jgi:hypothetical protein
MPTEQELVALFGDDFNEILLGLQQLPPEVRELLENTMGKMIYDAEVFANRINKTAQTQAAAGIAGTATQGMLATDMLTGGRVFGELRNSIKESLVEGINQTGQAGSFQAYDPEEETLFVWVTVAGHKICADCAPRGGEQRKLRLDEADERMVGRHKTIASAQRWAEANSKKGPYNYPTMPETGERGYRGLPSRYRGQWKKYNKFNYRGMSIDQANRMNEMLLESFKWCDDIGIPRIRGVGAVQRGAAADMGDGVLGFNKFSMIWGGKNIEQWRQARVKTGFMTEKELSKKFDDHWDGIVAKMKKNKIPDTSEMYHMVDRFDDAALSDSTFWHEFGHHIHQQKNVKTWGEYKPLRNMDTPFEIKVRGIKNRLDEKYGKTNIQHYPTEYSKDNLYEWFAENYSIHMNGRDDLLTPEFLQFLIDENIFGR